MSIRNFLVLPFFVVLAACGNTPSDDDAPDPTDPNNAVAGDLPLGDVQAPELKEDGTWQHATTCKPVPDLPRLEAPEIHVSIDGLTLRLLDPRTGYDKVFPIGPGAIDTNPRSITYGESDSMDPVLRYHTHDFEITPDSIQPCKVWWTDGGVKRPVFAGLPFLSWSGNYGIHGPVDNYDAPNGGNLRRGFVSHGCLRMEAADILEVYARIRGVAHVPVHVQREPERDEDGKRIDVSPPWVGSECDGDEDCAGIDGGVCKTNPYGGRGFCTMHCQRACPDRAGYPTTYCVADPDDASQGICVEKIGPQNPDCRTYDHFVPQHASRFNQRSASADVCLPGSRGWIGDHCLADADCQAGNRCAGAANGVAGVCTQDCARYCPDKPDFAPTFCTDEPSLALGAGACVRQCTPESNDSECPAGTECVDRTRHGQSDRHAYVCVPAAAN